MNNLTGAVIILISLIILCFASIIIINIVDKRSLLLDEDDFITNYMKKKKRFLAGNGIFSNVAFYITIVALVMIVCGVFAFYFTSNVFIALLGAIVGYFIPDVLIKLISGKKKDSFDSKYEASLMALAASLKAGLSIQQAIEEICLSKFVDEELKSLYRNMNSSIKMGTKVDKAFFDFAEATQSVDAKDVASAIALQEEIGGNEAETIESVARTIAERLDNKITIKGLMTDSKMLINVFAFMPAVFVIALVCMMPDLFKYYFSSFGGAVLFFGLIGVMYISIGIAVRMRKKALNI